MKKWITIFLLVLFLIIVIYLVANLSAGRTTFFGKAVNSGVFNATNSYVFASPLTASIGGEKMRVTVFALDDRGRGIAQQSVSVVCKQPAECTGVNFEGVQQQTDTLGRALYDLSSSAAGKFEIQASIEGIVLPQSVTVVFR